ncbi:CMF_collapsed_G0013170.mRNA.1.CDS.1 [Saccharomyces cerevisiae]|nr:CMF_collapsed_G0013170.mRNA.1.CDS.1 [Saccharomyces cerevisiae]
MVHNKVTIIGSGPAAHTAAIYLARAEIKPILYEGMMANGIAAGGQLTTTTEIENFPGFPDGLTGSELMDRMREQSTKFGTEIITETVSKKQKKPVNGKRGKTAYDVSEEDVPIFRNKPLAVIGGGDSACEEAQFLTKYGSKVFMLVRKDHLRASTIMQKRAEKNEKIEILYNTVALEAKGETKNN